MPYSVIGIINLSLGKIGVSKIDSLDEDSTAAIQANLAWPFVRDEVLEAHDWIFAKVRKALARNDEDPVQGFDYAYTLPSDFLKIVREKKLDPVVYPTGSYTESRFFGEDFIIQGTRYNYVIETLEDGTKCLFTDYDNSSVDLILQYIRREENPARYSAHFITTVSFRMAAELANPLTESMRKFESMMGLYEKALPKAKGHNLSGDYVENETGSSDWINAGR